MRSMTGYGRGLAERDGRRVAVEIRSVNHRFLDLKLRGATLDPAVEDKLSSRVRERVSRGALAITVRVDSTSPGGTLQVDVAAARRVHQTLRELAELLQLPGEVPLSLVCQQPGVLVPSEERSDDQGHAEITLAAADRALSELLAMREAEGASLADDLAARLERLGELTTQLDQMAEAAPEEAQRRLKERLSRLLKKAEVAVDEQRLAQEVAVLSDRLDVTEELVRVRSHIDQLTSLMKTEDKAIGRRLDFLVQELGREYNTVASKSQSADIASTVVEAKAELEKIREQVQNIE